MLYGFNKPVVILIKRSSKTKIEIPSNIIGIEQIRYKDFSDLQNKLKSVLTALFEISTKQTEFLLDLKPVLEFQIEQIELAILAKYLIGENIKAELHSLKYIDGNPIIIVNKGTENGLRNNMILSVVSLGEQIGEEYLEEEVGRLVVKHVQEKICQCQLLSVDPSKQFWRDFLEKGSASKNIVKPYINEVLRKLTDEELKENLSKLKILLSGYTIRTRGG
jgi:ribosomal protein L29